MKLANVDYVEGSLEDLTNLYKNFQVPIPDGADMDDPSWMLDYLTTEVESRDPDAYCVWGYDWDRGQFHFAEHRIVPESIEDLERFYARHKNRIEDPRSKLPKRMS